MLLHYKLNTKQNYKRYELAPLAGQQKSFYKKAYIEEYENGDKILYSYDTPVLFIARCGVFYRLWGGYSTTTAQHIKAALGRFLPKAEWDKMAVCCFTYGAAANYEGWGVFSR